MRSKPNPVKGRTPKTPRNVERRWTNEHGWRFRARISVDGESLLGAWRGSATAAQQDIPDLRKKAAVVPLEKAPELITVGVAVDLFLERARTAGFRKRKIQPCRADTVQHYKEITETILRVVGGEVLLHTMDTKTLQEYLGYRAEESRKRCACERKKLDGCNHEARRPSPARLNKERAVWGRIFQTVIDEESHPGPNPIDRVKEFTEVREEAAHFEPEQVVEILEIIRSQAPVDEDATGSPTALWFADAVALLFLTGMRLGELAHLRMADIDLKTNVLSVPREGKTGYRPLPLCEPHLAVLERLMEGRPKNGSLIPGTSVAGRKGNLKSNMFPRWRKKLPAGLQAAFHAHTLRHSFQTHLLDLDVARHHVKALMGHSDRDITDIYSHVPLKKLRTSMEAAFKDVDLAIWSLEIAAEQD